MQLISVPYDTGAWVLSYQQHNVWQCSGVAAPFIIKYTFLSAFCEYLDEGKTRKKCLENMCS
jgi:hypothetical protein